MEGFEEGKKEAELEITIKCLQYGLDLNIISKCTRFSRKEIRKIAKENNITLKAYPNLLPQASANGKY